ncbi:Steroid 17-alpha-hydroxylase/17,20 lyase [Chelonia mydas]|uniref:Steroid 17-alpha-hydroxylase/17,20 lyase n=1 Tax=Chelonia mydas TaxID=8469 RepID=M7BPG3_CHEMY|nr:Steroid 17-alpha-hydroxylase/17,20 lyase [Chelonia mydas]
MVPLLGLLLLLLVLLSSWRLAKGKAEPRRKYPRSLPSLPIIGSLLHLTGNCQFHLLFPSLQKKYGSLYPPQRGTHITEGSLYSLQMGSQYMVVVNHYLHAKEVLLKKGKTFAGRPHTGFTQPQRAKLTIGPRVCREAASLCESLSSFQDALLDMAPELNRAVTNVVCSLCFNSCYRRGDPEFEAMLQYNEGIVNTVGQKSLVDIFPWLQVFPNKDLALLRSCIEVRDQLLQKKFKEHKKALGSDSVNDLMDALLRVQLNMENNNSQLALPLELTDDHILMTVADIFGAGVETTSTVLKWAVLYLLHYPEVQRKIREELDQKIGFERHPQLSDRQQLPYLEATISEVLRIRPVSPLLLPHVALTDTSIGEYTIRKGAQVLVNLWSLHHDEKEWDKPEEFNPGRFLDEEGNRIYSPSPSYLPFGAGSRVCLGEALAKMEIFLFLAWILQRFTLELLPGQPLPALEGKFGVVLQVQQFKVMARLRAAWRDGV